MTKPNDGGPAFPHDNQELGTAHRIAHPGMTLRDWFAGQALTAIIQADGAQYFYQFETYASTAYLQAEAMLAAREFKP